jgi:hypothetical protein
MAVSSVANGLGPLERASPTVVRTASSSAGSFATAGFVCLYAFRASLQISGEHKQA